MRQWKLSLTDASFFRYASRIRCDEILSATRIRYRIVFFLAFPCKGNLQPIEKNGATGCSGSIQLVLEPSQPYTWKGILQLVSLEIPVYIWIYSEIIPATGGYIWSYKYSAWDVTHKK